MIPIQNLSGGPIISARAYPIASNTAITEGQLVKLSGGKVVAAVAAETGAILGIAAENHGGTDDALNPRNAGTEIMVYDDADMIMECPAPIITATGGSATTITTNANGGMAAYASNDFVGAFVQLAELTANSTNTDAIGSLRGVTASADSSGTETLTLPSGGTANSGDKYYVYPPIGFAKGNFDTYIRKLILSATASVPVRVCGFDTERKTIKLKIKLHHFGATNG